MTTTEDEQIYTCDVCAEDCKRDEICCMEKEQHYNVFSETLKSNWKRCDLCNERLKVLNNKLSDLNGDH